MADSQPKPERPKPDPKALTPEYHKARKQLMLWAAILFVWELVGIDLEKAKQAGGNAGAILGAIKSPQAVPWALLILVLYFTFKLRTEWRQCNQIRKEVREAKQDYYSAFVVAGSACALYFGQAISHVQFADRLQSVSGPVEKVLVLAALGVGFRGANRLGRAFRNSTRVRRLNLIQLSFGISSVLVEKAIANLSPSVRSIIGLVWITIGITLLVWPGLQYLSNRSASKEVTGNDP